jgi:spermidine synthase
MSKPSSKATALPEVNFSEDGESRYLHLGTPWIQGSMKIKEPFDLDLEYIQRMMVGLLFLKSASVAGRLRYAVRFGRRQPHQVLLQEASLDPHCH